MAAAMAAWRHHRMKAWRLAGENGRENDSGMYGIDVRGGMA